MGGGPEALDGPVQGGHTDGPADTQGVRVAPSESRSSHGRGMAVRSGRADCPTRQVSESRRPSRAGCPTCVVGPIGKMVKATASESCNIRVVQYPISESCNIYGTAYTPVDARLPSHRLPDIALKQVRPSRAIRVALYVSSLPSRSFRVAPSESSYLIHAFRPSHDCRAAPSESCHPSWPRFPLPSRAPAGRGRGARRCSGAGDARVAAGAAAPARRHPAPAPRPLMRARVFAAAGAVPPDTTRTRTPGRQARARLWRGRGRELCGWPARGAAAPSAALGVFTCPTRTMLALAPGGAGLSRGHVAPPGAAAAVRESYPSSLIESTEGAAALVR